MIQCRGVSWAQFQGVDFDWDLSDKTDTETQTRRGAIGDPHTGPADAIVQVRIIIITIFVSFHISFVAFQTDQRIVFQNSKAVRFSNSEEKVPARKKSSASQTRWELKDKEVQVVLLSSQFWREKMKLLTILDYLDPF